MATVALLKKNRSPTDDDIDDNIVNICRCGTYVRIRKAIHRAAELNREANPPPPPPPPEPEVEAPAGEPTEGESHE